jgi:hypothetical protein
LLVTHEQASRHGLERTWFAQIPLDPSRSRVTTWYLYNDRLYGVTDSGIVTSLNAETGEQLWAKQVGKPGYPAFGPGANADYLGVVSGAKLYLLDRQDGRLVWIRELGGAPSSGPALSNTYAFVALLTGRIEGYKLDDPAAQPWYYQSKGRTYLRPTATGHVVSWPTAEGYLYVSRADDPGVLFRLETSADIVTSPAASGQNLFIASQDGYLYCVNELTGREQWRYSTGYAITSSPAVVGDRVFVASSEPALHAVDVATGKELWSTLRASHFAAQGKQRVYASDRFGNLLVIDSTTGAPVSRMHTAEGLTTLVNDQSDRIYLVNDRGLVQCLREIGSAQATLYRQPLAPAAEAAPAAPGEGAQPAATAPPQEEPQPAAGEASPFGPADAAEPAEEPGAEPAPDDTENPFGT